MHDCTRSINSSSVSKQKWQNNDSRHSVLGSCRCGKVVLSQFYPLKWSLFVTFSFLMTEKSLSISILLQLHMCMCPIGMVINISTDRVTDRSSIFCKVTLTECVQPCMTVSVFILCTPVFDTHLFSMNCIKYLLNY